MAKRKKVSNNTAGTSRSTVGGLSLKPRSSVVFYSKRAKTGAASKTNAPAPSAPANSTPSPFWRLPAELRNNIYEMCIPVKESMKVVPKRPRSSKQKAHKSFLDPLLVCKQWYSESAIIFISSMEFQFENFDDILLASDRLSPLMQENIASISWHEPCERLNLSPEVSQITDLYPALKRIRIFLQNSRYDGYLLSSRYSMTEEMFVDAFGSQLDGLRSLRGLEDFIWVLKPPRTLSAWSQTPPNLDPGRTIFESNWDAFSEWVRKEVTKKVGT